MKKLCDYMKERAIKNAEMNHAIGPDAIHKETIKLIDENNIELLLQLLNARYMSG